MNRRDAILQVAGLMGASFTAPLLMGLSNLEKIDPKKLSKHSIDQNHQKMIETIAEIIIPQTSTPGAKAAKVPEFIIMMIEECYPKKDKDRFYNGLNELNNKAKSTLGKDFLANAPSDQLKLLLGEEEKSKGTAAREEEDKEIPFIVMIKELTMFGYFTSEEGCTQANIYVPVPGRFDACITIPKDHKAWSF